MSDNNGFNFDKVYRSPNTHSRASSEVSSKITSTDSIIKSNWSLHNSSKCSNASSSAQPYSSFKNLTITPKRSRIDSLFEDSNSKRFKLNDNDSLGGQNEPLSLRRTRSRFSVATPSTSTSPAPGFSSDFKFVPSLPSERGRDSPSSILNNLNLSCETLKRNSYFYPGKTTYGGANLRKNIQRPSFGTPYSRINVKCIEPKQITRSTGSDLDDLPLGSSTQRILDRLNKAAVLTQDVKSRNSLSNTTKSDKSRLFDTPTPSTDNKGRCNIDFTYKPVKYILKPVTEDNDVEDKNDDNNNVDKSNSAEDYIEKANQLKKLEKELAKEQEKKTTEESSTTVTTTKQSDNLTSDFIPRKNLSLGKITSRDVKKGRRIDDIPENDDEHLQTLANTKPLVTTSILKPLTLLFKSQNESLEKDNKSTISDDNNKKISDKTFDTCDTVSASPSESLFKFSSPKLVANLSSTVRPTIEIKFSSPVNVLDKDDNKTLLPYKSLGQKSMDESKSESNDDKTSKSTNEIKQSTSISLAEQFKYKKQSNIWSCPTCCSENDINVDKCVACEEINPNSKNKSDDEKETKTTTSTTSAGSSLFKFGETSGSSFGQTPLSQLCKKDSVKNWTCPTCSVSNNIDEKACVSCEEPNPNYNQKQSNQDESAKTTTPKFSFGFQPSITTEISKPVESSTKQPSLNELFKKKDQNKWSCPTCMVDNNANENKCVSCEEPNPNMSSTKKQTETTSSSVPTFGFKFGNFSTSKKDDDKKNDDSGSSKDSWQCFYCKSTNENGNTCKECKKIKLIAATKDQVQKFYQTQTFKFGTSLTNFDTKKSLDNSCKLNLTETKTDKSNLIGSNAQKDDLSTVITTPIDVPKESTMTSPDANKDEPAKFSLKSDDKSTNEIIKPLQPFKFGSVGVFNMPKSDFKFTPQTITTKSDSNESSNVSLFSFGSNPTVSTTSTPVLLTSTTTSSTDGSSIQNPTLKDILDNKPKSTEKDSTVKEITKTSTESSSTTTTPVTTGFFTFASKSSTSSSDSNKFPPLNFGALTTSNSGLKASSLFNLATKTETNDKKPLINSTLPTFSFNTSKAPTTTTVSTFTFGATATVASTTPLSTSTSTSTAFGKGFNTNLDFGSPVVVPKIDQGPPTINQKININFPSTPNTTNTTTAAPLFEFGSNVNKVNTNPTMNSEMKFNFGAPPTLNPGAGFSSSIPASFNFMGRNNNTGNTMFSFGAKPNESCQSSQQPAAPEIPKPQTGFTFPTSTNTFGGAPNMNVIVLPQSSPSVMPAFNASGIGVGPPTNQMFKFGQESNFQTPFTTPTANAFEGSHEPAGQFQFSSSQTGTGPKRPIKKAKRRLGRP